MGRKGPGKIVGEADEKDGRSQNWRRKRGLGSWLARKEARMLEGSKDVREAGKRAEGRVSFPNRREIRASGNPFSKVDEIVVFTSSSLINYQSVAKRKACLRQKRHRAGSVSLFCAIVSSSD